MGHKGVHWLVHEEYFVHIVVSQKASQAGVTSANEKFNPVAQVPLVWRYQSVSQLQEILFNIYTSMLKVFWVDLKACYLILLITIATSLSSGMWFLGDAFSWAMSYFGPCYVVLYCMMINF